MVKERMGLMKRQEKDMKLIGDGQGKKEGRNNMRKFVLVNLVFGTLDLITFASAPATFAVAHEGHQMECNESSINALKADIQSMSDGESKTTAMKEVSMAEQMMAKHDMDTCMSHMHKAMEAIEK